MPILCLLVCPKICDTTKLKILIHKENGKGVVKSYEMKIIKEIIKKILRKLSRVVFNLIPDELHIFFKMRTNDAYTHYKENEILQCFNHFEKHLQNAIHLDGLEIRKYAIEKSLLNEKSPQSQNNYIYFMYIFNLK